VNVLKKYIEQDKEGTAKEGNLQWLAVKNALLDGSYLRERWCRKKTPPKILWGVARWKSMQKVEKEDGQERELGVKTKGKETKRRRSNYRVTWFSDYKQQENAGVDKPGPPGKRVRFTINNGKRKKKKKDGRPVWTGTSSKRGERNNVRPVHG